MPSSVDRYIRVSRCSANYWPIVDWVSIKMLIKCQTSVDRVWIETLIECWSRCRWSQLRVNQGYWLTLDCRSIKYTWSNYSTIMVQELILSCWLLWRDDSYSWNWTIHKFTQFILFKKMCSFGSRNINTYCVGHKNFQKVGWSEKPVKIYRTCNSMIGILNRYTQLQHSKVKIK